MVRRALPDLSFVPDVVVSDGGDDEERGLFGDVDGVVTDAFQASGNQHVSECELALIGRGAQLQRRFEYLAVESIDRIVLAVGLLRPRQIARRERCDGLVEPFAGELDRAPVTLATIGKALASDSDPCLKVGELVGDRLARG
jgi:hypothetical protein